MDVQTNPARHSSALLRSTDSWESRRANHNYGFAPEAHPGESQGRPKYKHALEAHQTIKACPTCVCSQMALSQQSHRTHQPRRHRHRGGQESQGASRAFHTSYQPPRTIPGRGQTPHQSDRPIPRRDQLPHPRLRHPRPLPHPRLKPRHIHRPRPPTPLPHQIPPSRPRHHRPGGHRRPDSPAGTQPAENLQQQRDATLCARVSGGGQKVVRLLADGPSRQR
jgi:hypothetical protein